MRHLPWRSLLPECLTGGDLVPLYRAPNIRGEPTRKLAFPRDRQLVVHGGGHLELLGSRAVAQQMAAWLLAGDATAT